VNFVPKRTLEFVADKSRAAGSGFGPRYKIFGPPLARVAR
jgi:hypothetical protein